MMMMLMMRAERPWMHYFGSHSDLLLSLDPKVTAKSIIVSDHSSQDVTTKRNIHNSLHPPPQNNDLSISHTHLSKKPEPSSMEKLPIPIPLILATRQWLIWLIRGLRRTRRDSSGGFITEYVNM
jgi:hypothetical protein